MVSWIIQTRNVLPALKKTTVDQQAETGALICPMTFVKTFTRRNDNCSAECCTLITGERSDQIRTHHVHKNIQTPEFVPSTFGLKLPPGLFPRRGRLQYDGSGLYTLIQAPPCPYI